MWYCAAAVIPAGAGPRGSGVGRGRCQGNTVLSPDVFAPNTCQSAPTLSGFVVGMVLAWAGEGWVKEWIGGIGFSDGLTCIPCSTSRLIISSSVSIAVTNGVSWDSTGFD